MTFVELIKGLGTAVLVGIAVLAILPILVGLLGGPIQWISRLVPFSYVDDYAEPIRKFFMREK